MQANALNILFLSNRGLLPIVDGHTRRSFNVLKGLSKFNNIHFLSLYEKDEEICSRNLEIFGSLCEEVEFFPSPKRYKRQVVAGVAKSLFSPYPYTIWRHYSSPFDKRVQELAGSGKYHIIHCDILPLSQVIRKSRTIFKSVTDHDISYQKTLMMAQGSRNIFLKSFLLLESLKLKFYERKIFKHVDLGICVSLSDKHHLQKLCPSGKFMVVENGVESDMYRSESEDYDERTIVWVGGFDHFPNREGMDYFLSRIFPLVRKAMPEVKFDIVGGSSHKIHNITGNDPSIRRLGYVDDPLAFVMRSAVFVAPLLSGGGTKLKVLEAMAAGKAIVSTSVGIEGICGKDGEHFVVADDSLTFANQTIRLLRDERERKRIGANARNLVMEHYDFERIAEKLNSTYQRVVRNHSSRLV